MAKATISPSRTATQPFESARKDAATLSLVMPRARSCSTVARFSRTDVRTREMPGRSASVASRRMAIWLDIVAVAICSSVRLGLLGHPHHLGDGGADAVDQHRPRSRLVFLIVHPLRRGR